MVMQIEEKIDILQKEIKDELLKATKKFGKFNSAHEGYAVILEEVDELWDEVKKNQKNYDLENQKKECIQIAAMAIRYIIDTVLS